jgi:hypothetical protein
MAVLLYFYICENALKLSGLGLVKFASNLWNIYDLCLLVLYSLYFLIPHYMPIDISYFRLIRILLFLGVFIKPLQIMLLSLSRAFKFLLEAVLIMVIFSTYFALQGLHLFQGLFRNTCLVEEVGIPGPHRFCGYEPCPSGQYCG